MKLSIFVTVLAIALSSCAGGAVPPLMADESQQEMIGFGTEVLTAREAVTSSQRIVPVASWTNLPIDIPLNTIVTGILEDAVRNTRRPMGAGRNQNLVDEIQTRLDSLAGASNKSCGDLDRYWMTYYQDRTMVYAKPTCSDSVLNYTIMLEN